MKEVAVPVPHTAPELRAMRTQYLFRDGIAFF